MALCGGKPCLRRRRADPPQRLVDGQAVRAQPPRKVERLVESPGAPPGRMQGNRDEAVGVPEQFRAPAPHQAGQRLCQRTAPVVLQRVDDGAKCAVVGAGREGAIDEAVSAAASRAARHRHADDAPRRQRIAAAFAERGSQRPDGLPAGVTDRPARRVFEELVAGRAGRREDDREDGIAKGPRPSTRLTVRAESPRARRCPRGARARRTGGCPGRTRAR